MVLYGRNWESPVPVVAASTPSDCFDAAIEAVRIALKYRTPVFLLSDAYLANGSEPWCLPEVGSLPDISTTFATEPNQTATSGRTCATRRRSPAHGRSRGRRASSTASAASRSRTSPATSPTTPDNHEPHGSAARCQGRADRRRIPPIDVDGDAEGDELLVLGWGGTYGPIGAAVRRVRERGGKVGARASAPPQPVPAEPRGCPARLPKVLVPEMNLGQLLQLVRAGFLVDAVGYNQGAAAVPFRSSELADAMRAML